MRMDADCFRFQVFQTFRHSGESRNPAARRISRISAFAGMATGVKVIPG